MGSHESAVSCWQHSSFNYEHANHASYDTAAQVVDDMFHSEPDSATCFGSWTTDWNGGPITQCYQNSPSIHGAMSSSPVVAQAAQLPSIKDAAELPPILNTSPVNCIPAYNKVPQRASNAPS